MVTRAIPEKLIELIYSRHGMVPLDDLEFITVIRDAGLISHPVKPERKKRKSDNSAFI